MQPETSNSDRINSIYQTLLNRNRGDDSVKGFLSEAILRALNRSYASFSKRFPELADYIFDSIGNKIIASEVIKFFSADKEPNPYTINRTWAELLPLSAYEQSSSYLLEAATTFIELIYFDFLKEPVLKPLLIMKYDASVEHISDELTSPSKPKVNIPTPQGREKAKPPAESKPAVEEQSRPIEYSVGITHIQLEPGRPEDLTPEYLSQNINPYLIAIANLQLVINEILELPSGRVLIKSISQVPPIRISLDGAAEATKMILEIIVPWRQKHAQTMAQIQEQETLAEIESKKAEVLEKRARADKDRVEASKQRAEADRLKLENEKMRVALSREKFQLGLDLLNRIRSDIPREDKITLLTKLVPHIELISMNDLDISIK